MKKLLLVLLCLPMIGVASFPVITDTKECERIIVPLDYDINQKTDNEKIKIEIKKSPVKYGIWWIFGWLRLIFLSFLLLTVIALSLADIN
jgi:hypothetical protein